MPGGAVTYQFADALGSVIALTNASGLVTEKYAYTAYGINKVIGSGTAAYRFAGRRFDAETGLYHNRARAYSPALGRFLQTDPIGTEGGINLYAYVQNDPLNNIDPLGLFTWQQAFQIAGGTFEAGVGAGIAVTTAPTIAGTAGGGLMFFHGLDQIQAGIRGTDSFTSQGMQAVGVSQNTANAIDTGISAASAIVAGSPLLSYQLAAGRAALSGGGQGTSLLSATARGYVIPGVEISGMVTRNSSPAWQTLKQTFGTASVAGIAGRAASQLSIGAGSAGVGYSAAVGVFGPVK